MSGKNQERHVLGVEINVCVCVIRLYCQSGLIK